MNMPPETFRPPPRATLEQKRHWEARMRAWLGDELDRQNTAAVGRGASATWEEICIVSARAGNADPLRALYPQFADCIHAPPMRKRKKRPRDEEFRLDKVAADF